MRISAIHPAVIREMRSRKNDRYFSFERKYNCKLVYDILPDDKKKWYLEFCNPKDYTMFILKWG